MMLVSSLLQDILSLLVTLFILLTQEQLHITEMNTSGKEFQLPKPQCYCLQKELFSSVNQQNYSRFSNSGWNSVRCGGIG